MTNISNVGNNASFASPVQAQETSQTDELLVPLLGSQSSRVPGQLSSDMSEVNNTGAEKLLNIEMPATNPKASTETLQALTAGSSNIPIQNKTMPTADLTAIFGTPSPNTDTPAATLQMFADMNR